MSCLTIYQDNHTDSTIISNRFIDEYMQAANDAQLKIYLYLLRMMSASRATSISDIADLFNYTEKDVMRALKYWEKHHLLTLDLDEHKNVIGIHLRNFDAPAPTVSVPPAAPPSSLASVVPITAKLGTVDNEKPMESELSQAAPVVSPEEQSEASIDNIYVKPNYTLDELKAFKSDEATARLLFVAEQYLKKTLSATEVKTILFISDKLGFSEDLIDYLIQYCVDRGKKELRYIEKVAISWAQQGVTSPRQAAKLAGKYDKSVYEIMKALGKSGTPTKTEVAYITRWTKEYCFTDDIIYTACERTVLATDKHRFEYADRILTSWQKSGVHSIHDIQSLDDHYRRAKPSKPAAGNKFNQFTQNDYDFDALEQELISN